MDPNNRRQPFPMEHPPMDDACEDWRSQLQADSRPRVVDKIMGTLRHFLPSSGDEGDEKLQKIATTFEENAYHAATDQIDYLRRISLEMLKMESKCDPPDPMLYKSVDMSGNSQVPAASQSMQPQVRNQSQSISVMMASNQPTVQGRPQFMTQNIQININCAGIQSSAATLQPHMQQQTQQNNLLSSSQPSFQQYQKQLNSQTLMARMLPQQQQMVVTQSALVDSTAQTGNSDAQEEVYQKLKVMKDLYFVEIHDIYQKICSKLLQYETRSSEQANSVAFDRLKVYKQVIERLLQILQLSRSNAQHFAKDILLSLEKQILQVVNTHRSRRPGSNLDPVQGNGVGSIQQNPASAPQQTNPQTGINMFQSSMNAQQANSDMLQSQHLRQQQEQQLKQMHPNSRITMHQPLPYNLQQQQMKDLNNIEMRQSMLPNSSRFAPSLLPGDPEKAWFAMSKAANIVQQQTLNTPASLDSSALTGYSDASDEVYQKLKAMKDLYFAGIHDIHQRVCLKLQQHTPSSQQAKLEAFGKLEVYKQMLERILQILQLSKNEAQHFHKDKLPLLEKQILQILHTHRPNSFSC